MGRLWGSEGGGVVCCQKRQSNRGFRLGTAGNYPAKNGAVTGKTARAEEGSGRLFFSEWQSVYFLKTPFLSVEETGLSEMGDKAGTR